jgi:hypothetical protein
MAPGPNDRAFTHGYWLVAFIDLLGQQEAFLKTDYLPEAGAAAKRDAFIKEVQASVGVIRAMRRILDSFRAAQTLANTGADPRAPINALPPEALARAKAMLERRVRDDRWSDGVMLSASLMPSEGHTIPILGVYDVLCTCGALMLAQLAMGHPIRGGIDVGTGMEVDGELFGASIVKAYRLESKRAHHPRLIVGQDLVNYIKASTTAPGLEAERQLERLMATALLPLIVRDEDREWIVDYAGPKAKEFTGGLRAADIPIFAEARAFAHRSRSQYQQQGAEGIKLFEYYSRVVRYLDARASLWGDAV